MDEGRFGQRDAHVEKLQQEKELPDDVIVCRDLAGQ
jgi:hypothetical protein